jgi:poly-gamma-glutamate capsule biosynthesis protein CapA/YwtB (metallophosphatase superfamily)
MRAVLGIALTLCLCIACAIVVHALVAGVTLPFAQWGIFNPKPATSYDVLVTGDVFLGRSVERWQALSPANDPFVGLTSTFARYQYTLINFEAAVPAVHQPTPDFQFQFSVASTALPQLAQAGVTHASLANNHSNDFGPAAYQHTRQVLAAIGVMPVGHPQTVATTSLVSVETELGLVAMVTVNAVGVTPDVAAVSNFLEPVRANHELVVVVPHWGEEYTTELSLTQRTLRDVFVAGGVDVVLGHHPHVLQPVEQVEDTLIVYSLGNTIFDQFFSNEVQTGLLVGLGYHNRKLALRLYPISSIDSRYQPQLLTGRAGTEALLKLANLSDPALREAILESVIPLP